MAKVFIATVKIAFFIDNDSDAADAVSGLLTENLQESGAILDWKYADSTDISPNYQIKEIDTDNYTEGDAFKNEKNKKTVSIEKTDGYYHNMYNHICQKSQGKDHQ